MKSKKIGLTTKIFIGLILGLILGIILNKTGPSYFRDDILVNGIFTLMGTVFLNAIKMMESISILLFKPGFTVQEVPDGLEL